MTAPVIYENLVQGTDEWLEARRGIVTASVIGKLITTKTLKPAKNDTARALTRTLVAEMITGHIEPVYVSDDMEYGTFIEPIVRDLYTNQYAPVDEVGFMTREIDGHTLGYSPDGLVGDDGLIEIKSRKQHIQLAAFLDGEVPAGNMAQIQAGLLVSKREWCDYISYCGGMPLFVKRVEPDPQWQEAIAAALAAFDEAANDILATYREKTTGLPITDRIDMYAEMVI